MCCRPVQHKPTNLSVRWQTIFLISRQPWGLACSRMATATPTSPPSCERQDAWYSLAHGREGCAEQCSLHASAMCAIRCQISGGEILGGDPLGRCPLGCVLPLRCPAQGEQHTLDIWASSPRCMYHDSSMGTISLKLVIGYCCLQRLLKTALKKVHSRSHL